MWSLAADRVAEPYQQHKDLLANVRLRLGATVTAPESDAIQLPSEGLALDQKLLIELDGIFGSENSNFRLAFVARPTHLKNFVSFFETDIEDCPAQVEVPADLRMAFGTLDGLEIVVLVIHGHGLGQRIVSRRIFRLIRDNSGYSVRHVWRNDSAWVREGHPPKTGWMLEEPDFMSAPGDIVLYVHESLKGILQGPESEARMALSKQISVDIMFDLLTKYVSESTRGPEGTLGWIMQKKAEELNINQSTLTLATSSSLRAKLHDLVGVAE